MDPFNEPASEPGSPDDAHGGDPGRTVARPGAVPGPGTGTRPGTPGAGSHRRVADTGTAAWQIPEPARPLPAGRIAIAVGAAVALLAGGVYVATRPGGPLRGTMSALSSRPVATAGGATGSSGTPSSAGNSGVPTLPVLPGATGSVPWGGDRLLGPPGTAATGGWSTSGGSGTGLPGTGSGSPGRDIPPGGVTSAPQAVARCHTADLLLVWGPTDAAAGSVYSALGFVNTGGAPCRMSGFPGIAAVDATGAMIPVRAVRTGDSPPTVILDPGGTAWVTVRWAQAPGSYSGPACTGPAAGLAVTPPDETTQRRIAGTVRLCGDGTITVGPVRDAPPGG